MNIEACFYLGYTSKVHAKQGELVAKLDVDSPEEYKKLESVFIRMQKKDNLLIPFFIESSSIISNGNLKLKIADVDSVEKAKSLVGKELYLPLHMLPTLHGNKFYFHEVIDFAIIDKSFGEVGKVKKVLDYPTQAIFEIVHKSGKEVLVPITEDVVLRVDRERKEVLVQTPNGLIELYLDA